MRKKLMISFIFILLVAAYPSAVFASNYTGGVLDNAELVTGSTLTGNHQTTYQFSPYGVTSVVTDNDVHTHLPITFSEGFTYTFDVPHNITGYILNANGAYNAISFYDEYNQTIELDSPYGHYMYMSATGARASVSVAHVKKIIVTKSSALNTNYIREFNLFGAPTSPVLSAPSLSAAAGNAEVQLTWNTTASAESYNVYRSLTHNGPYDHLFSTNITSYSDTAVANGTTYYYVVTTVNVNGESDFSNEAAATPDLQLPEAPTQLSAVPGDSQIALNWNAADGAAKYRVKRSLTEGGPYSVVDSVYGTSYVDTAVVNGTAYYYVVAGVNGDGEGAPSNEVSATPKAYVLPDNRALLTLFLTGGQVKEYDVSSAELAAFFNWLELRAAGTGPLWHRFDKPWNIGPFVVRTEYVVYSKIDSFDVDEYESGE